MTYAKLDDQFPEHPKVASLSDKAFRAQVRGICYSNRLLTDGFIPEAVAHEWGRRATNELLGLGMWLKAEKRGKRGYSIHNFPKWNPSRAEVIAAREAKAAGGRASQAKQKSSTRSADAQARAPSPAGRQLAEPPPADAQQALAPAPGGSGSTGSPGANAPSEPSEPSPERGVSPNGQVSRRTEIKNALVDLSDWTREHMTPSLWAKVEKPAKDADEGGYSLEDLELAAQLYRENRSVECSPKAIVEALAMVPHWLANPVKPRPRR